MDDDFASTVLDQVPAGHRDGANPEIQNEPEVQETQELLEIAPESACDLPAGHGLGRIDSFIQKCEG